MLVNKILIYIFSNMKLESIYGVRELLDTEKENVFNTSIVTNLDKICFYLFKTE